MSKIMPQQVSSGGIFVNKTGTKFSCVYKEKKKLQFGKGETQNIMGLNDVLIL